MHWSCYIFNTILQKVQNSILEPHQSHLLDWRKHDRNIGQHFLCVAISWCMARVTIFCYHQIYDVAIFQTGIWANSWTRSRVLIIQTAAQKQMHTLLQAIAWYCTALHGLQNVAWHFVLSWCTILVHCITWKCITVHCNADWVQPYYELCNVQCDALFYSADWVQRMINCAL